MSDVSTQFDVLTRAQRLKAATTTSHDSLDKRIMAGDPFTSRERYGLFVKVQYQFHREIDALYESALLEPLLPDLAGRRRFPLIGQDLADLGQELPQPEGATAFSTTDTPDIASALGWLYVAEGSNIGAGFLSKQAEKLGLSDEFGARHLAGAPEGRGRHWRTFTAALDQLPLDEAGEARAIAGAQQAFARVRALVEHYYVN